MDLLFLFFPLICVVIWCYNCTKNKQVWSKTDYKCARLCKQVLWQRYDVLYRAINDTMYCEHVTYSKQPDSLSGPNMFILNQKWDFFNFTTMTYVPVQPVSLTNISVKLSSILNQAI